MLPHQRLKMRPQKYIIYSLRSSLAQCLDVTLEQTYPSSDQAESLANIKLDALDNASNPPFIELIRKRLYN